MAGDQDLSPDDPFGLDDDANGVKGYVHDTHRLVAPERTLERMQPLMPVMGITRLANLTGLDTVGLPVVMAIRPNARSLAVSSGKGLTLAAATVSGLMEAIELFHAERPHLPLLLASSRELRSARDLIDVERLPRLSVSRFHESLQLLWTEGFDLMTRRPTWVPFELVHSNFTLPLPAGSGCFPMTSNGLASGNHVLEAVSHALCEVVERDATALWHAMPADRKPSRRVALETIDDACCRAALDRLDTAGLDAAIWDMTSDAGIAAFECLIIDREPTVFRPVYATSGTGCHPTRETALLRAVTEAAQGRLIYIAGSRDDREREAYAAASHPDFTAGIRTLLAASEGARRDFHDVPTAHHASFALEVRWQLERLEDIGIEQVVVVGLERPEFGVPVVRVIVPGLEGVDGAPGYVPGDRATAAAAS